MRAAPLVLILAALPQTALAQEAGAPSSDAGQAQAIAADASVTGPSEAPAGATVEVDWTGPDADGDYIAVSRPDHAGYVNYTHTRAGTPVALVLPPTPGDYEIRYVRSADSEVLARAPLAVRPVEADVEIDSPVDAGDSPMIAWIGPDYEGDYIAISEVGSDGYVNTTPTREGSPLRVRMPAEPGDYELRYVMAQDATVVARKSVEVLAVTAQLWAEPRVAAGSPVEVDWDGPDYRGDYVVIGRPGDGGFVSRTPTRAGAPLTVTAPLEEGDYELRYVIDQDSTVLAAQPLRVDEVSASLEAAETAPAGAPVVVSWEGPAYERDFVSVARPEDPGYAGFRYVRDGSPLILDMPPNPGPWEIRYVAAGVGEQVLARRQIELTAIEASVTAGAEEVAAGAPLAVSWTGPDYRRDYIAIAEAGAPDAESVSFAHTSQDSPLVMRAPETVGDYELRYQLGRDDTVLARTPFTVVTPE